MKDIFVMDNTNGQTKKISGRHENSRFEGERTSLESIRCGGTEPGTNPFISGREDSDGGNTIGGYEYDRDTPFGKILQRLELVERSHKEYVRAHQTRLKARLDESERLEELFDESVEELRREIYQLATESESNNSSNGNGHKSS